ncbi:MAG: alpha/beta hydrolase [Pirellulaceae bacterium]|nr:alpha/beta hydrolase [Pirellulaceae bacterium]
MKIKTLFLPLCFALLLLNPLTIGQEKKVASEPVKTAEKKPPARPAPTVADYVYASESPRQVFDFWQAKSEQPTPLVLLIHGGGWQNGDKTGYGTSSIQPFLDRGISVAAINYRFINQAMEDKVEPPVKGCLHDAGRALQTLRSKAKEWNIDPTRVGATGSSAGACTSLWLALHDDLADPKSNDLVARQSTRLSCAAVSGAQTSLDPKQLREWIVNSVYGGHAFGFAGPGRSRGDEFELLIPNREKVLPWIKEYSPYELVTSDDPPLYLEYPRQKEMPEIGKPEPDPTHSSMYGIQLAAKTKEKNVELLLVSPQSPSTQYPTMQSFLIAKLLGK